MDVVTFMEEVMSKDLSDDKEIWIRYHDGDKSNKDCNLGTHVTHLLKVDMNTREAIDLLH